jgi:hypothetical protein
MATAQPENRHTIRWECKGKNHFGYIDKRFHFLISPDSEDECNDLLEIEKNGIDIARCSFYGVPLEKIKELAAIIYASV